QMNITPEAFHKAVFHRRNKRNSSLRLPCRVLERKNLLIAEKYFFVYSRYIPPSKAAFKLESCSAVVAALTDAFTVCTYPLRSESNTVLFKGLPCVLAIALGGWFV